MMPVTSKFNSYAYKMLLAPLVFPSLGTAILFLFSLNSRFSPLISVGLPTFTNLLLGTIIFSLLVWYFSTSRWTACVEISDYSIKRKGFYGLGNSQEWPLKELDGYIIREKLIKGHGKVEELLVKKEGKIVVRIVQPVFRNYGALREAVSTHLKKM